MNESRLQVSDLMVGDLMKVAKNVCVEKGAIVRILGMDSTITLPHKELIGCVLFVRSNDIDEIVHGVYVDAIEPIPLTPEILEKIDLKIGNVTEYLGYDIYSDEEGTFGVSEDREGFVFETYNRWEEKDCDGAPIDWGFYPVNRIKGIRYFHELQHALRLCRIDKEIIL